MKKTRKILSVILCLCMIMTTIGALAPVSVSAASLTRTGTELIALANNYDSDNDGLKCYGQEIIDGFAGKDASDKIYRIYPADTEESKFGDTYFYEQKGSHKLRYLHKFDFILEEGSRINLGVYIYNSETATTNTSGTFVFRPAYGITAPSGFVMQRALPTKISTNEWHNVAIEVNGNGSNEAIIYFDGEAYPCTLPIGAYGMYSVRGKIVKDTPNIYVDNYGWENSTDFNTPIYNVQDYVVPDITISDPEMVSYIDAEKKFKISDENLTVAEFKELVKVDGFDVEVYNDKTYSEVLADDSLMTVSSSIVVSNGNAFRYFGCLFKNNTDFDYIVNADGVSCTVTGFLAGKAPTVANTNVTIPDSIAGYTVTAIGASAFSGNANFGVFTMPDTVKTIGNSAFVACYGMDIVAWPRDLEVIGSSAFTNAKTGASLSGDFTNTNLKEIKNSAFSFTEIKELKFPDGLEKIGESAFTWCANVKEFIIPDSVTSIGNTVINASSGITKIRFPRNNTLTKLPGSVLQANANYSKDNAKLLKDVRIYIPETITEIPDELLRDFKDGANVTIYGVPGSAAYQYYLDIKAKLEAGTYVNNAAYGSGTEADPYKDLDKDGKGEIASIIFYDFDFTENIDHFANDIQTGELTFGIIQATTGSTMTPNVPGNGGKLASDVIVNANTTGGSGGHNYTNAPAVGAFEAKKKEGAWYGEICVQAPLVASIGAGIGLFKVSDIVSDSVAGSYFSTTAWAVFPKEIRVNGKKVMDAVPGRWYTIATEVKCDGSKEAAVYINGVKYDLTFAEPVYGVRHFRIAPATNAEFYDVYYDNLSGYLASTKDYYALGDKEATLTAKLDAITIENDYILYADETAVYTAGELKAMLETDEFSRANIRIYSDATYQTLLSDDENVSADSMLVVAATNGYPMERTYSYYRINPPVNRTIFKFSVVSEANKTAKITGFNQENIKETDDLSTIEIPENIIGYTITEIGDNAFYQNRVIENLTIPDTVTKIGASAFGDTGANNKALGTIKTVKMSKNIKEIGASAFQCNPIKEIDFPVGLEKIGTHAFWWTNISKLSLPNTVTYVGERAFRLAPLSYLKLSSGLTEYTAGQFASSNITVKNFIIPASVTEIGPDVFRDTTKDENGDLVDNTATMKGTVVYGVKGTYAEEWAKKYSYEFKEFTGDVIISDAKIYGDGSKEFSGTDFDLRYGYKNLTFKANLLNISSVDKTLAVNIALYDANGDIITSAEKEIELKAETELSITEEDGIKIDIDELKAGYSVKVTVTNTADGVVICDSVGYTFSDEKKEAEVSISVVGGTTKVFVNGEDKGQAPSTERYEAGTALKYVATPADSDKEFLYWAEVRSDRKLIIVSDEEILEITAGFDVTYTAIYADTQDAVYVTFKANNKILAAGSKNIVEIPSNPYMAGYVFDAWYNTDGVRLETSEIILSELTANTMYVAGFKVEQTAYTVSVTGANEQGGEFVYNSKITLTPAGEDGKYFAYWMRDGKIVCYTSEYTFYVSGNTNVEAVYADEEAEKQIVLVMAEPVIVGDNLDKIGFYAERNVPEGYTVAETGILMSQAANFDINTSGVIRARATSTAPAGQFTVRKGNAKGQTWYAKAYLIYSDGEKTYTVYSNTVSKTVE